jgi:cystathionine beta-lyase family protein involved in aluminum resistance
MAIRATACCEGLRRHGYCYHGVFALADGFVTKLRRKPGKTFAAVGGEAAGQVRFTVRAAARVTARVVGSYGWLIRTS